MKNPLPLWIIKIGGSLCSLPILQSLVKTIKRIDTFRPVIIPGGGPFADLVRQKYTQFNLTEETAHWMAVMGMEQYGYLLQSLGMGKLAQHPGEIDNSMPGTPAHIFLPYHYLKTNDPLPHSWNLTSDSIAAYLAGILGAKTIILLKPVDGVLEHGQILTVCSPQKAAQCGLVDTFFPQYMVPKTSCWIINGQYPSRLAELCRNGKTKGTFLKFE